jgi:hypothetical protein
MPLRSISPKNFLNEERSLQAGFQHHLTKPVDPRILIAEIPTACGINWHHRTAVKPPRQ